MVSPNVETAAVNEAPEGVSKAGAAGGRASHQGRVMVGEGRGRKGHGREGPW